MRKVLITLLSALLVCSVVFAQEGKTEGKPAKKPVDKAKMEVMNNVTKMDKDGARTALCLCGKEVSVADNTPTYEKDGTTYYLCSDACKDKATKASKADLDQMMREWRKKFKEAKVVNNVFMKEGKPWANCVCGKVFEVNSITTPKMQENGVAVYLCSDACKTQMHTMTAADRMGKEKAIIASAAATPKETVKPAAADKVTQLEKPKEAPKEMPKEAPKEAPKDAAKEAPKDAPKDTPKEPGK
jgi:YHS domain-containing protein